MLLCGIHSLLGELHSPSHTLGWINRAWHKVSSIFPQQETIERHQLGVWSLSFARSSGWNLRQHLGNVTAIFSAFPLFRRLATEVYALRPGLSVPYVASSIWNGIEPVLLLYLSSRLLEQIETVITTGQPDTSALMNALVARVFCVIATIYLEWLVANLLPQLSCAIKRHFGLFLLRAQLRLDIPTVNDPKGTIDATSEVAWDKAPTLYYI
ncbi:hypothetical protein CPB85DRAFT_1306653 [Mucidula mucida]|nr:hypothetical protein CPB85DRAFT_1306653 [Mucidula mucida]